MALNGFWRTVGLVSSTWIASACTAQMATPPGFVALENPGDYDYRATTADGVVVSAKALDDSSEGDVEFWARAIENEMRYRGGYALLDRRPVSTKGGLTGKQLRFGHDEGSEPHLYFVTVLVGEQTRWLVSKSPKLYLLEAGGTKALMEQHAAQIDWTIKEFDPNAL